MPGSCATVVAQAPIVLRRLVGRGDEPGRELRTVGKIALSAERGKERWMGGGRGGHGGQGGQGGQGGRGEHMSTLSTQSTVTDPGLSHSK
jgi:hypothetical protein